MSAPAVRMCGSTAACLPAFYGTAILFRYRLLFRVYDAADALRYTRRSGSMRHSLWIDTKLLGYVAPSGERELAAKLFGCGTETLRRVISRLCLDSTCINPKFNQIIRHDVQRLARLALV